jgi:hypothetical protein
MNKYSLKIINFLNILNENSKYNFKPNININHPLLNNFCSISDSVLKINIIPKYKNTIIPKLHSKKYPLLYEFYKAYYAMKNDKKFTNFYDFIKWYNLSQHTIDYDDIFKEISLLDSKSNIIRLYKLIFTPESNRENLHNLIYQNMFIGLDITQYVETTELYEINISTNKYDLFIYLQKDSEKFQEDYIIRVIRIIELMFKINDDILNQNIGILKINIIFTRQPKRIPINKLDLLSPININSGSCHPTIDVNVWRTEEFEKVLIHEIQHFLECDFNKFTHGYDELTKKISNIFNIIGNNGINEAYNETMAHIISMCYQHKKLNIELIDIYQYEMFFSLFQTAKILNHFGANSISQIMKMSDNKLDNIYIKQTTSVLSYYIIKTYMLFNINQTLDLISQFNLKCNNYKKIKILSEYIQKLIVTTDLDLYIKELITEIQTYNYQNNNKFIMRTLRMTAIE